jgi:hypothetical protein
MLSLSSDDDVKLISPDIEAMGFYTISPCIFLPPLGGNTFTINSYSSQEGQFLIRP